jgi:FkbM family methyltransferase
MGGTNSALAASTPRTLERVHYYADLVGWTGAAKWAAMKALRRDSWQHKFRCRRTGFDMVMRLGTTDASAYENVIALAEYAADLSPAPEYIVDCGANVGYSSLYFAARYPSARIIAIEPDASNFEVLEQNVQDVPTIAPVRAAIWNVSKKLALADGGVGHWGMRVAFGGDDQVPEDSDLVEGVTIPKLMSRYSFPRIDLLKVDIEGAELELFSEQPQWLERVKVIAIELHDRFRPGCAETFEAATRDFSRRWTRGENTFVSRQ